MTYEKKTKLERTLPLQTLCAPLHPPILTRTSPGPNQHAATFTLILIAAASITGFLNTGLNDF